MATPTHECKSGVSKLTLAVAARAIRRLVLGFVLDRVLATLSRGRHAWRNATPSCVIPELYVLISNFLFHSYLGPAPPSAMSNPDHFYFLS